MAIWMWMLLIFIILQRLVELVIARNNEKWMKERGGVERGEDHYKWFIILHFLFFLSLLVETHLHGRSAYPFSFFLFSLFFIAQICRIWCIYTLGRFWNTKIIVLPRVALIKKGPYKYVKHPNYFIVGIELFVIPMLFGAYATAIVFPILHLLLLRIRIPREEKALTKVSL
ncbi:isoprenylcysteine carboxyl methyltransferase family protein [Virgibacillus sp. MG-45]|uniref:isoprenylcysteine carboxyl methyltransferase family protein n=1 Tax=Virgibacillus sp. MG-45 TaxID=3102791 RepID=UPI002EDBAD2F